MSQAAVWLTAPTPVSQLQPHSGLRVWSSVRSDAIRSDVLPATRLRRRRPGRLALLTQLLSVCTGPCLSAALAFPASLLERLKIDYFFKRTPHLPLCSLPDSFSFCNDPFISLLRSPNPVPVPERRGGQSKHGGAAKPGPGVFCRAEDREEAVRSCDHSLDAEGLLVLLC